MLRPLEVLGWVLAGWLTAVAFTWPLLREIRTSVPGNLGDPMAEMWEVAWSGHAIKDPGSFWNANHFHPYENTLAFSDSLLGLLPLSLVGSGSGATIVKYNVAFLLAYALCFIGATLLAREIGVRPIAAAAAGVAYAYAGWRVAHVIHLNILLVGGIPLALFFITRGLRRERAWLIIVGFAVAAWQVSIGWAMGIYFLYLFAAVAVVVAILWWRSGQRRPARQVVVGVGAGGGLLLTAAGLLALPYLRVLRDHPDAERGIADVDFFGPPARGLLSAYPENVFWGERTAALTSTLPWAIEQTLWPGVTVLVLALVGLASGVLTLRLRLLLLGFGLLTTILSLGTHFLGGHLTYRPLLEYAPGWAGLRTPGRLFAFTTLCLGLLAAAGVEALLRNLQSRPGHADRRWAVRNPLALTSVGAVLATLVYAEGMSTMPLAAVPRPPAGWEEIEGPATHLPTSQISDMTYMYWSTDGFGKMTNGNTSYIPADLDQLRTTMQSFPDQASIDALRRLGVRTVVLHERYVAATPWEQTASKPIDGLPLTREDRGEMTVYTLTP